MLVYADLTVLGVRTLLTDSRLEKEILTNSASIVTAHLGIRGRYGRKEFLDLDFCGIKFLLDKLVVVI